MDPGQIGRFMKLIINEKYDFVSGSRFLKGSSRKNNPLIRLFLIKIFGFFLKFIFKKRISDATCGFRAFRVGIFKNFRKNFFKSELYTYGYEYFCYGKILISKNINFCEVAVSMNYPKEKDYSKIRPIIDWYIISKYWIKGLLDKHEL